MIELKLTNLKLLKKEFKLGNRYIYVTRKKEPGHQKFTILDKIENGGTITLKEYDVLKDYNKVYGDRTYFKNWRWGEAIFTLLTKEEASEHLKNVITSELTQ